jgi:hypothetical protein
MAKEREARCPTDTYAGGRFFDKSGRAYQRLSPLAEADSVHTLIHEGANWVLEMCDEPRVYGKGEKTELREALSRLVGSKRANALRRKQTDRTVIVAELWRASDGSPLVIFVEQAPSPRAIP